MKKGLILSSNFSVDNTDTGFLSKLFCNKIIQEKMELFALAPHTEKSLFKEDMDGVHVQRFPYFYPFRFQKLAYGSGIPYNLKNSFFAKLQVPIFLLSEFLYTMQLAKKEKVDFINSHWLIPQGLIGALCSKILGIPHIASMHSSEITLLSKLPMRSKISEFILSNSHFVISASSHRASELLSHTSNDFAEKVKDKIHIIPMGVDVSKMNNPSNKEILKEKYGFKSKYIVLFVGRLVEVKGCEYLIQGFKTLVNSFKNVQLLIVGNGPLEESLEKKVKALGLEEYVVFNGAVEYNSIQDFYIMADFVVIPSIVDSSGFQEGLPVVLIESLAAGKAIISTKTKGIMEVIQDGYNGILVNQKDANEISTALLNLLNDNVLMKEISTNALKSGKKYDWNIITNEYLKLMEAVSLD
jgi:glycosyltransferase involved in cell wall biosynthesis